MDFKLALTKMIKNGVLSDALICNLCTISLAKRQGISSKEIEDYLSYHIDLLVRSIENKEYGADFNGTLDLDMAEEVLEQLASKKFFQVAMDLGLTKNLSIGARVSFNYLELGAQKERPMYNLSNSLVSLYFNDSGKVLQKSIENISEDEQPYPQLIYSKLVINDYNLRYGILDIFYSYLSNSINSLSKEHNKLSVNLNIEFNNCWVKGLNIIAWKHLMFFPGMVSFSFNNCEDFDSADFPYLVETNLNKRNIYYLDIEYGVAYLDKTGKSKQLELFIRYMENNKQVYFEHLR